MNEEIKEVLQERFPSYRIKQTDTINSTVRIRILESKKLVGKRLGLFPIFEYHYNYKEIPFKHFTMSFKQRFLYKVVSQGELSISLAIDEFNKVLYWKYSF